MMLTLSTLATSLILSGCGEKTAPSLGGSKSKQEESDPKQKKKNGKGDSGAIEGDESENSAAKDGDEGTDEASGSSSSTATGTGSNTNTNTNTNTSTSTSTDKTTEQVLAMLRTYAPPPADNHFFTTSTAERDAAVAGGQTDEGIAFYVFKDAGTGRLPVLRLKAPDPSTVHYFTLNSGERDSLVGQGWTFEKEEGYMAATELPGTTRIYHLYNAGSGDHLFTLSFDQKTEILKNTAWAENAVLGFAPVGP